MPLSRRSFLVNTAAAGALAHGGFAFAATPPVQVRHGAFDVTVISDGHLVLPTSFLAAGAPEPERAELLRAAGQAGEQYDSPTNITLIRTASDLILVDMGSGDRFMPTAGKLWDNLAAAGIDKDRITKVVFTHGHPDHLWGAVDDLDELMLPNATFYVGAAEWDFWHGDDATRSLPAGREGFVTGARRNYAKIKDRVTMLQAGAEIVPGLQVVSTPGHTQGHVSLALAGGDGLIVAGDAITHPIISFRHPEWRSQTDHVPELAATTRARLLDRLASDKSRVIGFHLPYPGIGTVVRDGNAYRFVAGA